MNKYAKLSILDILGKEAAAALRFSADAKDLLIAKASVACQYCSGPPAEELHSCPFNEEVLSDYTKCNCCATCRENCEVTI